MNYLQRKRIPVDIRYYLKKPLTEQELRTLIKKLQVSPKALVRTQEPYFKQHLKGKTLTDEEWIAVLLEHPRLLVRPIVESADKAVIAIPPEKIDTLL